MSVLAVSSVITAPLGVLVKGADALLPVGQVVVGVEVLALFP